MNLLVGVLCEDGVVVSAAGWGPAHADGADAAQEPLAASSSLASISSSIGKRSSGPDEPVAQSTFAVEADLILAGTGRLGLGQRFAAVVRAIRSDSRFQEWTGLDIAKMVCAEAIDDFASTRCDRGQFGALVALAACDGFQLCEFPPVDLQPELKTPDRWFASMGPGKPIADAFLAFLQRTLFADSPLSLADGLLAAAWALDHAAGLGSCCNPKSMQVAVLAEEAPGLPLTARLLSERERADCLARVRAAERHLASFPREIDSS